MNMSPQILTTVYCGTDREDYRAIANEIMTIYEGAEADGDSSSPELQGHFDDHNSEGCSRKPPGRERWGRVLRRGSDVGVLCSGTGRGTTEKSWTS